VIECNSRKKKIHENTDRIYIYRKMAGRRVLNDTKILHSVWEEDKGKAPHIIITSLCTEIKKKKKKKKANICPSGSDMNSWCRWTHPRTKHDDLRFQCVTHIRVRVGFSHVLVFFLFCDVVGELRNHCCWRLLFLLHHRKREIRHCRPKIGAKNKREKRGGLFWYSQQIAKKELLTVINVGIY
jgi:hypothetical protein